MTLPYRPMFRAFGKFQQPYWQGILLVLAFATCLAEFLSRRESIRYSNVAISSWRDEVCITANLEMDEATKQH